MAIKIVVGYDDPEFPIYENYFWSFCPDDWDYMIIGDKHSDVADLAEKLMIFDYTIKQFPDRWIAVTYHS